MNKFATKFKNSKVYTGAQNDIEVNEVSTLYNRYADVNRFTIEQSKPAQDIIDKRFTK